MDLPPTTGPCPHCAQEITSPSKENDLGPSIITQRIPLPFAPPHHNVSIALNPGENQAPTVPQAAPHAPVTPKVDSNAAPAVKGAAGAKPSLTVNSKKRKSSLMPIVSGLAVVLIVGAGTLYFLSQGTKPEFDAPLVPTGKPAATDAAGPQTEWQKDATALLEKYIAATTLSAKLPMILNGDKLAAKIEAFHGSPEINDLDTPAKDFKIFPMSEEEAEKGVFLMIYDKQTKLSSEKKSLTSPAARSKVIPPIKVLAFFKRTPEGLKIDWEVLNQTKYQTLKNFLDSKKPPISGIFRVFIVEDTAKDTPATAGIRSYQITDPGNLNHRISIPVSSTSPAGIALSTDWSDPKEVRTATVELKWTGTSATPQLEISRLVCWEYLGLGGTEIPAK